MVDVVAQIEADNRGREAERRQLKYRKMQANPFVFLRGTCHLFYVRLPEMALLQDAPLTWSCGDLHLENFGSYKGDNRQVYFDINDFDEAALAPCTWDLVRFLTSVRLGMSDSDSDHQSGQTEGNHLGLLFLQAYSRALALGKARWVEKETAEGPVKVLLEGLAQRKRKNFLDSRTTLKGHHRRLRLDNGKALPVTEEQRASLQRFMQEFAGTQAKPDWFTVRDMARRVAGTGSLGVERFIILVEGKGSPDGNYFLDLKQAVPSALALALTPRVTQPCWTSEAERVVHIQYRLQASSMAFLQSVTWEGGSYLLRGLQPSEDRVVVPQGEARQQACISLMQSCGEITAWAHLRGVARQGSASADDLVAWGERRDWQSELLALSQHCAQQTIADWRKFCQSTLAR
jgi:Uncharacterized protein conserved in bacteria